MDATFHNLVGELPTQDTVAEKWTDKKKIFLRAPDFH